MYSSCQVGLVCKVGMLAVKGPVYLLSESHGVVQGELRLPT